MSEKIRIYLNPVEIIEKLESLEIEIVELKNLLKKGPYDVEVENDLSQSIRYSNLLKMFLDHLQTEIFNKLEKKK